MSTQVNTITCKEIRRVGPDPIFQYLVVHYLWSPATFLSEICCTAIHQESHWVSLSLFLLCCHLPRDLYVMFIIIYFSLPSTKRAVLQVCHYMLHCHLPGRMYGLGLLLYMLYKLCCTAICQESFVCSISIIYVAQPSTRRVVQHFHDICGTAIYQESFVYSISIIYVAQPSTWRVVQHFHDICGTAIYQESCVQHCHYICGTAILQESDKLALQLCMLDCQLT